jgi:hypothetical protein
MKRYLLSIYQPDGPVPAPEVLEPITREINALIEEIKGAGAWVFEGPDAALSVVEGLDLDGYHLYHAISADLLRRLGRDTEAALAYDAAIARTDTAAERAFLRRRQALTRA